MKIFKAIKLHRKLRTLQEQLCYDCCLYSQIVTFTSKIDGQYPIYPHLNYFAVVNKATKKISDKLPRIYFYISDIFGLYKSFKPKKDIKIVKLHKPIIYDIVSSPGFSSY